MASQPRILSYLFLACVLFGSGMRCQGVTQPLLEVVSPRDGARIESCAVEIEVAALGTSDPETLEATLNGQPLALESVRPSDKFFVASLSGGPPLAEANTLVVSVEGKRGGASSETVSFTYAPGARARRITDAEDLIEGPLAQGRVGDWLLENCTARFVIQDGAQRDLHSVGQYGGNLIDAELVGRPGRDQFFEMQPSLNVETVVNAQDVYVLNDGTNGQPAIVRACGPDDLLDYINPSSVAADLGLVFPPSADDRDLDVEACTEYSLAPGARHVRVETIVSNPNPEAIRLFVGDYTNGMGSLEQWTPQSGGIGEISVSPAAGPGAPNGSAIAQSYFGFGSAEGVDYALVPQEFAAAGSELPVPTSSFTDSGVTFVAHSNSVVFVFLGFDPTFEVPGAVNGTPGTNSFVRFFGVGDGSPSNAADLRAEVLGLTTGRLAGCVTVGGAPAPGARVAVGPTGADGRIVRLATLFVTDEEGCYEGRLAPGTYGAAASLEGAPYEGGQEYPQVHTVSIAAGGTTSEDFALPAGGHLRVFVRDETGTPLPARVSVVGFDPSPEPRLVQNSFVGNVTTGLFRDVTKDGLPFGLAWIAYAGADGVAEFDLEPGTYQVFASRGSEYSAFDTEVTVGEGGQEVVAQIARVIDTTGFVSSDYHVHMLNSPDSRIGLVNRVLSFAGEGVDNIIATEHDAHTDLAPVIEALGLREHVHATIGEEITTFDYGHFNGYPQALDPDRTSGGSTDWGGEAPPGEDFPAYGNFVLTPAEIEAEAAESPLNAGLETVVQVNHINSHFNPLRIDTSLPTGPASLLPDAGKAALRLCSLEVSGSCAALENLFHRFAALELWNGASAGAQQGFLRGRIGVWMNLLNQGIPTTAIADTDTHTFHDLEQAGARTWTPASSDAPQDVVEVEIPRAVRAGKAVGGQGLYVQARLLATDGSGGVADFTLGGETTLAVANGEVDLEIRVRAPLWAEYDTIEIYRNAETCVAGRSGGVATEFSAFASTTLTAGDSDTGDSFVVTELVDHPGIENGGHRETTRTVRLSNLVEDAWFVVVAKGTEGVSEPMFPIYPRSLQQRPVNDSLEDLLDGNLGEGGVLALGFTNALYLDVDGGGFDAPGVVPPGDCL